MYCPFVRFCVSLLVSAPVMLYVIRVAPLGSVPLSVPPVITILILASLYQSLPGILCVIPLATAIDGASGFVLSRCTVVVAPVY